MNRTFENESAPGQGGIFSTAYNLQKPCYLNSRDAAIVDVGAAHQPFYFPRPQSVRGRILGALLRGERLTPQDSLRRFSDFRLAAQIEALRKVGWAIKTEIVEVATRDAGRRAEVAEYHLLDGAIADAGEKGSRYAEAARHAEIARRAA